VVDPFCGSGTTLAVANKFGLDAVGVDIAKEYCEKARKLKIE
jgi:DNA modification methylase